LKNFIPWRNFNKDKQFNQLIFKKKSKILILGCDKLPPLKEILSPRFGEARKKMGLGIPRFIDLGGYHP
jgi:hypothetical protein